MTINGIKTTGTPRTWTTGHTINWEHIPARYVVCSDDHEIVIDYECSGYDEPASWDCPGGICDEREVTRVVVDGRELSADAAKEFGALFELAIAAQDLEDVHDYAA